MLIQKPKAKRQLYLKEPSRRAGECGSRLSIWGAVRRLPWQRILTRTRAPRRSLKRRLMLHVTLIRGVILARGVEETTPGGKASPGSPVPAPAQRPLRDQDKPSLRCATRTVRPSQKALLSLLKKERDVPGSPGWTAGASPLGVMGRRPPCPEASHLPRDQVDRRVRSVIKD